MTPAEALESEALRMLQEARAGKKIRKTFTLQHGLSLQDYYRRQIDTANLRGLCLDGNHP